MGIVTDSELQMCHSEPVARSASESAPTMCKKCGKRGQDYVIDMVLVRARVAMKSREVV